MGTIAIKEIIKTIIQLIAMLNILRSQLERLDSDTKDGKS